MWTASRVPQSNLPREISVPCACIASHPRFCPTYSVNMFLASSSTMVEPGKAVTRTTCALSSRELIIVPPDVFLMSGLRVLDLSRNKLKVLPPEIKFLSSLLELNVSRNSLKSIPAELGYLAELETINALSNKLNQRTVLSCNSFLHRVCQCQTRMFS